MKITNLTRAAICLAMLIILFASPAPVKACLCGEGYSPAEVFMDSDAVFAGKVITVSDGYSPVIVFLDRILVRLKLSPFSSHLPKIGVTFTVSRSWKGVSTTNVTIGRSVSSDCSNDLFTPGSDFLVYARQWNRSNPALEVTRCSRVIGLSHATEDLSYLNTLPTLPLTPVYGYSWTYIPGAVLFLMMVLLLIFIILIRRQKHQPAGEQP